MLSMPFAVEPQLAWTDHYAKYGFAMVRGLLDRSFCDAALARTREILKNDRPLNEWSTENTEVLHRPYFDGASRPDPVFDRLFDQPGIRQAIETMFGGPGHFNGERNYYLFIKPYNPKAQPKLARLGHIDFPSQPVPPLYRGFTFQVLLADNEPFSGNLTVHPGTPKLVQKALIDDPQHKFDGGNCNDIPQPEPVEFVGKAGDVCFMHHLMIHSGNESHSANRIPRIGLHAEAFRDEWLTQIDSSRPGLSPWERSLALNGAFKTTPDVEQFNMQKRREYLDGLRKKELEGAAA